MNEIETKLKKENEINKELFNFNGDELQLNDIKQMMMNSQNDPDYYIKLFDHYSFCRPNQQHISKELGECIYSC